MLLKKKCKINRCKYRTLTRNCYNKKRLEIFKKSVTLNIDKEEKFLKCPFLDDSNYDSCNFYEYGGFLWENY